MKRKKLTVPIPCSQLWEDMSPEKNGNFCSSCKKTVVDFSKMSDAEILRIINRTSGKVCGQFSPHQLNRALKQESTRKFFLPKLLLGSVLSLGFTGKDAPKTTPPIEVRDINPTTPPVNQNQEQQTTDQLPKSTRIITGKILDKDDRTPLPGATISIKGTNISTLTDTNGSYKLQIPDSYTKRTITVVVKFVGYETTEVKLKSQKFPLKKDLEIKMQGMILGEIAIIED